MNIKRNKWYKIDKNRKKMLRIGKKCVIICAKEEVDKLMDIWSLVSRFEREGWGYPKNGVKCMCKACELGKVVINRCFEKDYSISVSKLHKLLILMHGEHLAKYQKPLFPENVICWGCGVAIKEIEIEFLPYDFSSRERLPEYIAVLNSEKDVINSVLEQFGELDTYQLNCDPRLVELTTKYPYVEGCKTIIPNDEIQRVFTSHEQAES